MSLVAIVPVASLAAANTVLQSAGYGPKNFSVPAFSGQQPSHAALHTWGDSAHAAAVKAVAGVAFDEQPGNAVDRTKALIEAQGADWAAKAPALPTTGNAVAGTLYSYGEFGYWWCIQTFSRDTFSADPSTYPALIRRARVPGLPAPWVQPIDQFDAYKLVNPFTNLPDRCTHLGNTWQVSQADGGGNNVFEPGVFGWVVV